MLLVVCACEVDELASESCSRCCCLMQRERYVCERTSQASVVRRMQYAAARMGQIARARRVRCSLCVWCSDWNNLDRSVSLDSLDIIGGLRLVWSSVAKAFPLLVQVSATLLLTSRASIQHTSARAQTYLRRQ